MFLLTVVLHRVSVMAQSGLYYQAHMMIRAPTLVVIRPPTGLPRILSRYKGQFRDINLSELEKVGSSICVYVHSDFTRNSRTPLKRQMIGLIT